MSDSIRVDIITIVRNADRTIVKTLESISNQDYEQIDHIIIDGNSTDNTVSTVDNYHHTKNKVIVSQNGKGIANAFNEGIISSSGDLVLFINAGDTLYERSSLTKIVDSYTQLRWKWACGETIALSKKGYLKRHVRQHTAWRKELFYYGNPLCHQSTIFTREHLQNIGFYNEDLLLEMDFEYNIRAALIADPHLLYFPISYYDISGVSSLRVFDVNSKHREIRRKYFPLDPHSDLLVESQCVAIAFKRLMMIPLKVFL
jgi:glycosyltransferase involved in cell wall biosynthesis